MKWQHWACAVLGVWTLVAPWGIGVSHIAPATYASVVVGVIQIAASVWAARVTGVPGPRVWQNWVVLACGLWFLVHPFLGHFEEGQYWATVIPGILTIVLILWAMAVQMPKRTG
ncbi:SPW repeat protein [Alicyclobacillus sp.]|uniref:SPW repeat domain-containing protein n=1 Tax=Alicyclobacillus sp. TaxID=61169 RepID=UPI0025C615D9|nr:SPW repeat protein [Alicyclobacillus sp.]MCL6517712.1 SPW repeat protein [Alicyclobacillus sp.]